MYERESVLMSKLGIGIPAFVILVICAGLGHLFPVLYSLQRRQLFSFQYRTDWEPISPVFQHFKRIVRK